VSLLLDTHALLWWYSGDRRLSAKIRRSLDRRDETVFASAASAWEIAIKVGLGRLPGATSLVGSFVAYLRTQEFEPLSIECGHAERAGLLPPLHNDPFDRMLVAQAQAENLTLVSNEELFDAYGVRRLW
jgi:PIN domain nuclease of toxin-antitoxin system